MKITFVLPGLSRVPIGGYKVVYQYATSFAECGNEVTIVHVENIAYKNKNLKSLLRNCLIKSHIWGKKNIEWFDFNKSVNIKFVTNLDEKSLPEADAIIATSWETAEPVYSLPKKYGKKFYFIQHYEIQHGHKAEVDETWKLPMTNIVIATWLKNIGVELGTTCKVVKNFVDSKEYYLTQNVEKRKPSISMLYHEEKWKGSKDGIKVLNNVLKDFPDIEIRMFGVPERPQNLDSRILYFQNCKPEKLREEVYNKTSIFLFTSHSEGWGLTATEAMACGNALVSTKNGGVLDFGIENETALLSDIKDIESLTKNVEKLIVNDALRNRLQSSCVKLVSSLTLENSTKQFLSIISKDNEKC